MGTKCSVERRRYREGHKRGLRERREEEEDDYYDRTNKKSKSEKKTPESREVIQETLAYKKKMLAYYEKQIQMSQTAEP